jgi:hypothetical protein
LQAASGTLPVLRDGRLVGLIDLPHLGEWLVLATINK